MVGWGLFQSAETGLWVGAVLEFCRKLSNSRASGSVLFRV